ncbi:MAG: T9SS type A sorting domain-containing protein [Bacteroidetes bacterium]|nr:T9SS type A sorting domain-containing protein [Bacteroidota bacterium]
MEIYNVYGELVYLTSNIKPLTSNEINLSAASGVYFVVIKAGKETSVKKIVISR